MAIGTGKMILYVMAILGTFLLAWILEGSFLDACLGSLGIGAGMLLAKLFQAKSSN
jgi:hypothetical protein